MPPAVPPPRLACAPVRWRGALPCRDRAIREATAISEVDAEETGYVAVEGGRVWHRINGVDHRDALPVPCIHGGPGFSHGYMLPLVDLADARPVVFYDQLDAGNADRPGDPANWRVERFVAEVDAVRGAVGLDRLVIIGSSSGGTVAAEYAIGRPAGLAGLVLSSSLINTPRWIADNSAHRRRLPAEVQEALDAHEAAGTTDSAAYQRAADVYNRRHFCRLEPWPTYVDRSFEIANLACYGAMWGPSEFAATGTLGDYDCGGRLHRIAAPALFTCGAYDGATPGACREFAALVTGAEVRVIENASHLAFAEQCAECMAVMRGFLKGLDESAFA